MWETSNVIVSPSRPPPTLPDLGSSEPGSPCWHKTQGLAPSREEDPMDQEFKARGDEKRRRRTRVRRRGRSMDKEDHARWDAGRRRKQMQGEKMDEEENARWDAGRRRRQMQAEKKKQKKRNTTKLSYRSSGGRSSSRRFNKCQNYNEKTPEIMRNANIPSKMSTKKTREIHWDILRVFEK